MKSECTNFDKTFENVTTNATKYRQNSQLPCSNHECPLILQCEPLKPKEIGEELFFDSFEYQNPLRTAIKHLALSLVYRFDVKRDLASQYPPACEIDYSKYRNKKFFEFVIPVFRRWLI